MKRVLIIAVFLAGSIASEAQSNGSVTDSGRKGAGGGRTNTSGKGVVNTKIPKYHGSHDYTPGSPVGTGGNGDNMSGSRANSALETALGKQKQDTDQQVNQQQDSLQTAVRKSNKSGNKKVMVQKSTHKRSVKDQDY
jgi:hypothetical protein